MTTGTWLNNDGLYLQYGTSLAIPETAGDFQQPGGNRVIEVLIDLTTLTSTAAIQSNTLFFPSGTGYFIEQVDVVAEVGAATGTSFSVGLIQTDRATIPTNYSVALVSAMTTSSVDTAGKKVTLTGSSGSFITNSLIGSSPASATGPYYITALSAGSAFTTGKVRVRISYHGIGTIAF